MNEWRQMALLSKSVERKCANGTPGDLLISTDFCNQLAAGSQHKIPYQLVSQNILNYNLIIKLIRNILIFVMIFDHIIL